MVLYSIIKVLYVCVQEYEEEGRRSRRHSSPCNSREGSTTALHTQHYDDSVSHTTYLIPYFLRIKKYKYILRKFYYFLCIDSIESSGAIQYKNALHECRT